MHKSVLITGFEPFGGRGRNPAGEAVRAVSEASTDIDLVSAILPVEYSAAATRLEDLLKQLNPSAWIGFGLNQKATAITLERSAMNLDDATIPDNAGDLRRGLVIEPDGPESYCSTLPLQAIEAKLREITIPTVYSDSAGRYICNHVFYRGLSVLNRMKPTAPAGFIHLPRPSDWDEMPAPHHNITFATIILAVAACASELISITTHPQTKSI